MENTPHKQFPDDLDYLAQLGFEQVPDTGSDVEELLQQVKVRSFSYNNGLYFGGICLLVGLFLGASLFFALYEPPPERLAVAPPVAEAPVIPTSEVPIMKQLDTVTVVRENFIAPRPELPAVPAPLAERDLYADSSALVLVVNTDVSALLKQPLREEKLRYIANAPVFYIHDLKITDYRLLYFKHNRFVPLGGTLAASANKESTPQRWSESPDIYLHEELAEGLLHFKKGRYDRCMVTLNRVAGYNKEDVNCSFYLGLCYYHKKNYAKAVALLDGCIVSLNNTFLQEALYYKALSLYESGDKAEALALFKQIAEEGEFYSEKAKTYLKAD